MANCAFDERGGNKWTHPPFFLRHQVSLCDDKRVGIMRTNVWKATGRRRPKSATLRQLFEQLDGVRDPTCTVRMLLGEVRCSYLLLKYVQQRLPKDIDAQLVAALHATGKLLSTGAKAWPPTSVFGSTRPLNFHIDPADIAYAYRSLAPNLRDKMRVGSRRKVGLAVTQLTPNYAVDGSLFWKHTLHMTRRAARMLRLLSFDSWHTFGAYRELEDDDDARLREDRGFRVLREGMAWLTCHDRIQEKTAIDHDSMVAELASTVTWHLPATTHGRFRHIVQ